MHRTLLITTAVAGLAAVGLGVALWLQDNERAGIFRPKDQRLVAAGRQIYADHCAACHGVNLEGEENWQTPHDNGRLPAPPHDETGHTWHHDDQMLFDLTKFGLAKVAKRPNYETDMPAFEHILEDEAIIAVLSYIKSRWPEDIQALHDQRNLLATERR